LDIGILEVLLKLRDYCWPIQALNSKISLILTEKNGSMEIRLIWDLIFLTFPILLMEITASPNQQLFKDILSNAGGKTNS